MKHSISLKKTYKSIVKHPYKFLFSILLDFILLAISFAVFYFTFEKILPHLEIMVNSITTGMTDLSPDFYSSYSSALSIISVSLISIFILFVAIKGTNWKQLVLKRKGYWRYMLKFLGVNAIWAVILLILSSLYLNFVFSSVASLNPIISLNSANIIFYLLFAVVIYFSSISYACIDKKFITGLKSAFIVGVRKADILTWNFILIFIIVYLMRFAIPEFPKLSALFLLFIILPMMAFNRFYLRLIV